MSHFLAKFSTYAHCMNGILFKFSTRAYCISHFLTKFSTRAYYMTGIWRKFFTHVINMNIILSKFPLYKTPTRAERPHVGTDPVSVRQNSISFYRPNNISCIFLYIGQTRGLSLHAGYRPNWNHAPLISYSWIIKYILKSNTSIILTQFSIHAYYINKIWRKLFTREYCISYFLTKLSTHTINMTGIWRKFPTHVRIKKGIRPNWPNPQINMILQ